MKLGHGYLILSVLIGVFGAYLFAMTTKMYCAGTTNGLWFAFLIFICVECFIWCGAIAALRMWGYLK
jgi:hypothetical protein